MRRAAFVLVPPAAIFLAIVFSSCGQSYVPTNRNLVGQVVTLAGDGAPGPVLDDGPALQARFGSPFGIAIDPSGRVIVSDSESSGRIRRLNSKGEVESVVDSGATTGSPPSAGELDSPSAIAVSPNGDIVIADTGDDRISKLSRDGKLSVIAGSVRGYQDGAASEAQFDSPVGVAVDHSGNIFVADTYNDRIRKIAPDGQVTTVAGTGQPGFQDGTGTSASFDTPCGIAVDAAGSLYVADTGNNAIRKITPQSEVAVFAGGARGRTDGKGADASFDRPCGIVISHDGFLFVTDESSGLIREITPEADVTTVAGGGSGFNNGVGALAKFNAPSGIALDRSGALYVADRDNYLIRKITPAPPGANQDKQVVEKVIQPVAQGAAPEDPPAIPILTPAALGIKNSFPWPLKPQTQWHEVAGVVGEARGAFGGIALDHLHSGLDIKGTMGEDALSVFDERVSSPIPNWGFGETGEGIRVGVVSYIHIRIGRNSVGAIMDPGKFKARFDPNGVLIGVRVRRGTRFQVGDSVGTLNPMNHVHLNLGPWNAQANPIVFPFIGFKDTVAPVIEPVNGIEIRDSQGHPFKQKRGGRLIISGDVSIVLTAYDRVDGNAPVRKLGLYRAGYQILHEDGSPAAGFEHPLINIDFGRLPADDNAVFIAYAPGSGVSAYGTPTKFRYIVTNVVKNGRAAEGLLRTSALQPGNYILKVIAEDYAGNAASGKDTLLPIIIENGS